MDVRDVLKSEMDANLAFITQYANGVSDEDALVTLPGELKSINWIVGHVAVNEDYFTHLLTGEPMRLPSEWWDSYQPDNSPPLDRASAVALPILWTAFQDTRARTLNILAKEALDRLGEPAPEGLPSLFPKRGDVWGLVATHPYWHVGHLASLRALLRESNA